MVLQMEQQRAPELALACMDDCKPVACVNVSATSELGLTWPDPSLETIKTKLTTPRDFNLQLETYPNVIQTNKPTIDELSQLVWGSYVPKMKCNSMLSVSPPFMKELQYDSRFQSDGWVHEAPQNMYELSAHPPNIMGPFTGETSPVTPYMTVQAQQHFQAQQHQRHLYQQQDHGLSLHMSTIHGSSVSSLYMPGSPLTNSLHQMMVQHPFHNFQVSPGLVTTITPAVNLSDIMSLGDLNMFLAPSGNPIDLNKQHIMPPRLLAGVINVKDLTLNELRPHFNKPMTVVAKELGVCITLMKKICRRNGLVRWPHRRIRSLVNRLTSLQVLESKADGAERKRFQRQITGLREELSAVIQNPNEKSRKAQISIHKIPANADQSVSQAIKQEYAVAETVFDMVGITDNGDDAKRWMRKMTNVAMKADSKEEFDVTGRALIQKPTRGAETCTKKRKSSLNLHIYQPPSIKIPRHDELPSMYRLRSHSVPERKLRGGQRSGWGRDTADSTSFLCARPSTTTHRSGRRGSISSILNDILE